MQFLDPFHQGNSQVVYKSMTSVMFWDCDINSAVLGKEHLQGPDMQTSHTGSHVLHALMEVLWVCKKHMVMDYMVILEAQKHYSQLYYWLNQTTQFWRNSTAQWITVSVCPPLSPYSICSMYYAYRLLLHYSTVTRMTRFRKIWKSGILHYLWHDIPCKTKMSEVPLNPMEQPRFVRGNCIHLLLGTVWTLLLGLRN